MGQKSILIALYPVAEMRTCVQVNRANYNVRQNGAISLKFMTQLN